MEILGVSEATVARWCPNGLVVINARRGIEAFATVDRKTFLGTVVAPVVEGGAHGFGGGPIHRELF
jgi:hypothetical protein